MAARRHIRRPVGANAHARSLHRALIADETDSRPRICRGVPRKSRRPKYLESPPTPPGPRRSAAGEVSSSTTLPRAPQGGGLRLRARTSHSGFGNNSNEWPHQPTSPAACAAPRPALGVLIQSVPSKTSAQGFGSAFGLGESRTGWGVRCGNAGMRKPQTGCHSRRSFHGRIHQGAERKVCALVGSWLGRQEAFRRSFQRNRIHQDAEEGKSIPVANASSAGKRVKRKVCLKRTAGAHSKGLLAILAFRALLADLLRYHLQRWLKTQGKMEASNVPQMRIHQRQPSCTGRGKGNMMARES